MWKITYKGNHTGQEYTATAYTQLGVYDVINSIGRTQNLELIEIKEIN